MGGPNHRLSGYRGRCYENLLAIWSGLFVSEALVFNYWEDRSGPSTPSHLTLHAHPNPDCSFLQESASTITNRGPVRADPLANSHPLDTESNRGTRWDPQLLLVSTPLIHTNLFHFSAYAFFSERSRQGKVLPISVKQHRNFTAKWPTTPNMHPW